MFFFWDSKDCLVTGDAVYVCSIAYVPVIVHKNIIWSTRVLQYAEFTGII